jgi:hypothetical protein
MRDDNWFDNTDPCCYCGRPVGCDAPGEDSEIDAQDFKGGGSTYRLIKKPKRVAHGNCDFWATEAEQKAARRAKTPVPIKPQPSPQRR